MKPEIQNTACTHETILSKLDKLRAEVLELRAELAEVKDAPEDLKKRVAAAIAKTGEASRLTYGSRRLTVDREEALARCAGKKRYRTPEGAGDGARSARSKGSKDLLRIYPCELCFGFHLTSVPLDAYVSKQVG